MFIKILIFDPIIVNFIWNKYFIIIRTNRTALYSNIHACYICKSRSTRYSALTFLNKTFICSQCDQNYIYILIKFNNQITEVNHTLPMRILYIVISTTYWLFNVPVHATLENSVARESRQAVVHRHRCRLGGCAITAILAEIAVAALALRAENSWQILQSL